MENRSDTTPACAVIEPSDFRADTSAFVDTRIERSVGKASYSLIGPGVSQNAGQFVNLARPHGFNVGAAAMPHGVINNPHLHFTAEVFICTGGNFRFDIGAGGEQSVDVEAGTVISVPTWVFRGFENTGPDDGWMFAVLGGDDTGGIIWAPHVLAEAAETGMYLSPDSTLIDAHAGGDISHAAPPLSNEQLAGSVASYTDAELDSRAVAVDDLAWSDRALLSGVLADHKSSMAPVIGHGISQHRDHSAPITNPHGFSLEWLELAPGSSTGVHRHSNSQVVFLVDGDWRIDTGESDTAAPARGSVVSVAEGAWRNLINIGHTTARAVVVCGSDAPTKIEWDPAVIEAAAAQGWTIDPAGYVGPISLLGGRP